MKALRQNAPRQDRNDPALLPKEKPGWTTGKDGSRYVAVSLWPASLDDLRRLGRAYGEAAAADACWNALGVWLMKDCPSGDALRNSYAVVTESIHLVQEHDRYRLGLPRHDGRDWPTPALDGLTPDCRREALLVAAETLADWKRAGSPYLDASRLKTTYQTLVSCPAFLNTYVGPDAGAADTNTQDTP